MVYFVVERTELVEALLEKLQASGRSAGKFLVECSARFGREIR